MKQDTYRTGHLLVQLGHLVTWFRNQKLMSQDLTSGQAGIIGCLRECADKGSSIGALVGELDRSKASVSQMLKTMEKKELVRRCEDPEDARKTKVFLTERGWGKEKDLKRVAAENEEIILSGMSEGERIEFNRLLKIALANMQQSMQTDQEEDLL